MLASLNYFVIFCNSGAGAVSQAGATRETGRGSSLPAVGEGVPGPDEVHCQDPQGGRAVRRLQDNSADVVQVGILLNLFIFLYSNQVKLE